MTIATPPPKSVVSLGLAIVSSSSSPLLLLDEKLTVLAGSASFCREFGIDPKSISGCRFVALGQGEWNVRQLIALLEATATGTAAVEAYEMDLVRGGNSLRHLVLNAQKLDYDSDEGVRLLLSVSDVTDAKLADKLNCDLVDCH